MRWIVAAVLLALSAGAHAEGKLRISSDRPVVIVVNMVPYTLGENGSTVVTIRDGREGNQNVRVRNLLGQEVWSGVVEVPKNTEVRARWQGRSFEVTASQPLAIAGPTRKVMPKPGAQDLQRLAQGGDTQGPAALEDVDALLRQADRAGAGGAVEVAEGLAPPPEGVPSRIQLVNRNTSWANVYIDGTLHEFRGGPTTVELELPSGAHRVEVKDFRDREDWGTGTLWVYPDLVLELHFSKHEPPAVLNKREAWRPDPPAAP